MLSSLSAALEVEIIVLILQIKKMKPRQIDLQLIASVFLGELANSLSVYLCASSSQVLQRRVWGVCMHTERSGIF